MKTAVVCTHNYGFAQELKNQLSGYETVICEENAQGGADFSVIDIGADCKDPGGKLFAFFKSLLPDIKKSRRSSVLVLLSGENDYKKQAYLYLAKGMCKSFAVEAAEFGCLVNCIEYGCYDERLAKLSAFFADERAYMTGQCITPDFSRRQGAALPGKPVALVTGSGQGIGLAMLKEFRRLGYYICLNDISETGQVKAAICETGAFAAVGDISFKENTNGIVKKVMDKFGRIDVFAANAAYMRMCPFELLDKEDFDRHVSVNIGGHLAMLEKIIPIMKKQESGKIILFSSMFGTGGWKNAVSYAGTKAAMIGLGQYLSKELNGSGVSVSVISPGIIDTPQLKADADDMGVTVEEVKKIYRRDIPLGRVGQPEDVAYLAGFLASGGSDYLSGRIMQTNGGEIRSTPEFTD